MSSSSTQQIKLKVSEAECPYCGSLATAEFEKGQQVSPFTCTDQECQAIEIGENDEDRGMSEKEWETGWWEPMREPPEARSFGTNGFFLEGIERDRYYQRDQIDQKAVMVLGDETGRLDVLKRMFETTDLHGMKDKAMFVDYNTNTIRPTDSNDIYNVKRQKLIDQEYARGRHAHQIEKELLNIVRQITDRCDNEGEIVLRRILHSLIESAKFSRRTLSGDDILQLIIHKAQDEMMRRRQRDMSYEHDMQIKCLKSRKN